MSLQPRTDDKNQTRRARVEEPVRHSSISIARWTPPLALALALVVLRTDFPGSVLAQSGPNDRPLSSEEICALVRRVIANQHRNDAALEQYERYERRQTRNNAEDTVPAEDKTFRVVPTGTGILRVQVEDSGRPIDAALYRQGLLGLEQTLVASLDANQPKMKQAVAKFEKRRRERAELVDAVGDAFRFSWLGRETRTGRTLVKLAVEPNPAFRPTSRNTSLLARVRATVWVDEAAAQLARTEAEIFRDISFGGGVVAKVYRGGRLVLEQTEVAPDVWLPTHYDYNFEGRKFLFGFEIHERTEASHYRRVGPPREALTALRRELNNTSVANPAR